ncbi:hypothetical protein RND81_01G092800 [Saponaria officinalis]|uniref:Uncharacterized protein n=1 Tax=Saponaria officinalis TaxID=3572 RepID=A0AAW1NDA5_SAPOF
METESEFDQMMMKSPASHSPKLKRLKKMNSNISPKSNAQNHFEPDESDALDPLFSEGVKRALQFTAPEYDADYLWDKEMESLDLRDEIGPITENTTKKKRKNVSDKRAKILKVSKQKENQERKAYLAQQVDFQRIMRERKSVGFKPITMIAKPISSVLQKIRQRKIELSKKFMLENSGEDITVDIKSVAADRKIEVSVKEIVEDQSCSCDNKSGSSNNFVDETEKSFRAPLDETRELFSDSQANDSQENPSNEESGSPAEDVSPSLPSLDSRLDSSLPDEISSDEDESDKENTEPFPKPSRKDSFSAMGDPVKEFLDEEALEDDSDNDLFEDKDEENDADMEEHCDYIATDFKEKPIDLERRNQLHQTWLQQQDEAGTENLLQKLKHGGKQQELTFLEVEDDDEDDVGPKDVEDKSDSEDTGYPIQTSSRATTKMLKQMIPQMFTDKDDGYVSSEDEETERSLSRQYMLRTVGAERKTKLLSAAEDDSSKEVLGRIRKLNSVPETKKKAKTPSFFDALLTTGNSCNSNKSSFLRRASSNPLPSSKRQVLNTGKSYIFGRDDSRSSAPLIEDSCVLQTESQAKKAVSAKFSCSQVKRCTQETQTTGEQVSSTSLFEILKRSSGPSGHVTPDNMVDHQAVFASFKSVKHIKVDRRF